MKVFAVALFVLVSVAGVFGACDPLKGAGSFNPDCSDATLPYCTAVSQTPTITFACVACVSDCDCSVGSYCSGQPGKIGSCLTFDKYGDDCRPLSQGQITNSNFTDAWKCAVTFTVPNSTPAQLAIDFLGACIDSTCRFCNYEGGGGSASSCQAGTGIGVPRQCGYPGNMYSTHLIQWTPGTYYETPTNVWWAVFFCFVFIMMVCAIISLFCTIRRAS